MENPRVVRNENYIGNLKNLNNTDLLYEMHKRIENRKKNHKAGLGCYVKGVLLDYYNCDKTAIDLLIG